MGKRLSTYRGSTIHTSLIIYLMLMMPSKADLMIPVIHMNRGSNQAKPQYFCNLNGQKGEQTYISKLSAIL